MKKHLLLICSLFLLTISTNAQIPTSGLVAWYPFNGNANDESSNGNNGTVNGATLANDRFGNANSAYSFNGTSNYINILNNILPTTPTSLTISLWFNSSDTDAHFICDRSGASNLSKYSIGTSPGYGYKVRSSGNPNCNYHLFASTNFNPLIWNHIIVTKDVSGQVTKLYLNGVLVGTDNHACYTNFSSPTAIGRGNSFYAPYGDAYTNGLLDDIGIWNRVLTDAEIQQVYTISDVPKTCLVAWFPFNGNANDLSVNNNNGTVNGATLTNDRFGNSNKAYSFNGSSNSITVPANATLEPSNKLTISVWAKPNGMGAANFPHLLTKRYCLNGSCPNGYNSYAIHYGADTGYAFLLETDSGGIEVSFGAKSYMFNQWTHLVATYDGAAINVYRNDTLITTKSHKGNIRYNTSLPLTIGYSSVNNQYYQGTLDDIGIWCRVLTIAEIKQTNSGAILPVKITNFTLNQKEKSINLDWTVTNEINVQQYNIKRSINGINFETFGKVGAHKLSKYNFIDNNLPNSNVVYYMLEIIDNDGKKQYSEILKHYLTKTQSLSIYPNPAHDRFIVECNGIKQIKIVNQFGQVVRDYNDVNANQKVILTQGLTKGLYIVQVFSNDKTLTQKLIIE